VKSLIRSGLLCSCWIFGALAHAQETPAPEPQTSNQQTPPPQNPPVQPTPPVPKPTVDLPPAPPPAPPPPPQERDTGGDDISIMGFYWLAPQQPTLRPGKNNVDNYPASFTFPGKTNHAYGGIVTFPTGKENSLQFTYWRKQAQGNSILPANTSFFGDDFLKGDVLAAHYTLQNIKLSWNYLTWPYPSNGAKFRVKTLWEVQYVWINSSFDAPADVYASPTVGSKSIIFPTLGLGIEYHPAKHVRFEVKGSGFGWPHRSDIWDTEANLVFHAKKFEVLGGFKAYHFKTSPKSDYYYVDTLSGAYAAVRYIYK
jgi:hypothetical protein